MPTWVGSVFLRQGPRLAAPQAAHEGAPIAPTANASGSRGAKGEVSADLSIEVPPLVMRASGKARGIHFRPWIVMGAVCQHPAYMLWYKQPPERRRPSSEVWKALAEGQEL